MNHTGSCFCGAVEVTVTGSPEAMGYCHCRSCRSWSGGPVNAFSLWKPEAVEITKGKENVATFAKTPMSERKYCSKCGGHLKWRSPPYKIVPASVTVRLRLARAINVPVVAIKLSASTLLARIH